MSAEFHQLLDATVRHLRALKARGARYVEVERPVWECLRAPLPARAMKRPSASLDNHEPAGRAEPDARQEASAGQTAVSAGDSRPVEPGTAAPAGAPGAFGEPGIETPTPSKPGQDEREAAMSDLRARALACRKCSHLAASRRNVVFGVGNIHSPLMFVGEAPGVDEDARGEPFVGKAGELLTRIIQTMGLSRQAVYIANVLKCRPDTPGQTTGNRRPKPEEMQTCLPYLQAQIDLIRPKVIVALGAVAMEGLFGRPIPIMKTRGKWLEFREIAVMPTYHPAYLLRNQSLAEKRKVWEDMLQVMDRLEMTISEKQRGFFLKARS